VQQKEVAGERKREMRAHVCFLQLDDVRFLLRLHVCRLISQDIHTAHIYLHCEEQCEFWGSFSSNHFNSLELKPSCIRHSYNPSKSAPVRE